MDNIPAKPFIIGYIGLIVTFVGVVIRFINEAFLLQLVANVVFVAGILIFFVGAFKVLDIKLETKD